MKSKEEIEIIAKKIVNAAFEVHKELGTGLLESVYEYCLIDELRNSGLNARSQVRLPVVYKSRKLDKEFIIDILVDDEIIIELKSVETLMPVHEVQVVTYLKLANKKLGFLINFNVSLIKDGIKRKINGYF